MVALGKRSMRGLASLRILAYVKMLQSCPEHSMEEIPWFFSNSQDAQSIQRTIRTILSATVLNAS